MRSNSRIGRVHRHVLMHRASSGETSASNWYDGALVAYQPLGAASYADSKINLANPSTYDATEGAAPSWASETGWTFNGVDQYLETGIEPTCDGTWSALARYTGGTAGCVFGVNFGGGGGRRFQVLLYDPTSVTYIGNGDDLDFAEIGRIISEGVVGFSGKDAFENGAWVADIPPGSAANSSPLMIGRLGASDSYYFDGAIQAIGVWDYTLTPSEVATISAAMAAL